MTEASQAGRNAYLMMATSTVLMGSAFTASKVVVDQVPPEVGALLRFGLGGLLMLVLLKVLSRGIGMPRRHLPRTAFAGLFGVFGYNALFFAALTMAPSIDGSIIVPVLSPIMTAGFAILFQGEQATPTRLAGLSLGLAGAVLFLVGVTHATGGSDRLLGDLVFLAAAVCWSVYTLLGKLLLVGIDPVKATTWATLSGSVLLAVIAVPGLGSTAWAEVTGSAWWCTAYLVVGPTAIAYILYYQGVKALGPSTASLMLFLAPLAGAVGGLVFLDESLTPLQWGGAALLLIGAVVATRHGSSDTVARRRRRAAATVGGLRVRTTAS